MSVNLQILHKEKRFDEIINEWNKNSAHDAYNEWDYLYSMNSFYATKQYDKCVDVYKECVSNGIDCKMLEDKNGWAIYHLVLKQYDFSKGTDEFLVAVDQVLSRCGTSIYSPRNRVIDLVIRAIEEGKFGEKKDYALIEKYLLLKNLESLSREEREIDGRKVSSEYEQWFSKMTKALLELGKYEECIDTCNKALSNLNKFHSNNDVWFRYRKAKSYRGLGEEETGVKLISEALSGRFSHWCLYEYLFDNAVLSGDELNAKIYGAKCATADREHKMRVTFYEKYAQFLESYENPRIAMVLRKLILLIRESEGWSEKAHFSEWNIDADVNKLSNSELLKELDAYWKSYTDREKSDGEIIKIIGDGTSGFIKDVNGQTYYFNARDFKSNKRYMAVGQKVRFRLVDGYDKKKGMATKNAIDITI